MQLSLNYRRMLGTALLSLALLGASCEDGDSGEAIGAGTDSSTTTVLATTTSAPPATTTAAAPTPEEQVLAAYHGYWGAVDDAFSLPQVQPDFPALSEYATGEALAQVRQSAQETRQANEAYRIPDGGLYEHRAEVVSLEATMATVRDCNIDDTVVVDTVNRESSWDGIAGCAAE